MTDDFKNKILEYLTGKYVTSNPDSEEIIQSKKWGSAAQWDDYTLGYNYHIEDMIAPSEQTNNKSVMYGGYTVGSDKTSEARGFIIILDDDFTPIKIFTQYPSGTYLRYIQKLNVTSSGTFYGVDDSVYSYYNVANIASGEKRFIILNNFTALNNVLNDYTISLNKSYIFDSSYQNFYCKYINKDENSAYYCMAGTATNSTFTTNAIISIITLKINVGSTNEWTISTIGSDSNIRVYGGAISSWGSSSVLTCNVITSLSSEDINVDALYLDAYSNSTITETLIVNPGHRNVICAGDNYTGNCIWSSSNKAYIYATNSYYTFSPSEYYHSFIYEYDVSTKALTTVKDTQLYEQGQRAYDKCKLFACNAEMYILYVYSSYTTSYKYNWYLCRYVPDINILNHIIFRELKYGYNLNLFAKQNYNLLQFYIYDLSQPGYNMLAKEIYNQSGYNGNEYYALNSMVPESGVLSSNSEIVFARNLYNLTMSGNTTAATIEVPNTYLNNMTINVEKLNSQTSMNLINQTNDINKNVYETLLINFYNTLLIQNQNTSTYVNNITGSTRLNNSITATLDYTNCHIGYYQVNYGDGATMVKALDPTLLTITSKKTTYTISVYVPDALITSIQLLSNDKSTIYQTIDCSNLVANNIYTITQDLLIS